MWIWSTRFADNIFKYLLIRKQKAGLLQFLETMKVEKLIWYFSSFSKGRKQARTRLAWAKWYKSDQEDRQFQGKTELCLFGKMSAFPWIGFTFAHEFILFIDMFPTTKVTYIFIL